MTTLLASVVSRSEETIDVRLSADVRCVEPIDPRDGQNPDVWTLSGPVPTRIVRLDATSPPGQPDRARIFRAYVDPLLAPGGPYALGTTAALRLSAGGSAPVESLPFVALGRAPIAGRAGQLGADLARPVAPSPDGGLALLSRLDALKARLELSATTRLGAFGHLPAFGSPLEPKRTLSPARLAEASRQLAAAVRADPDVRRAAVSVGPDPGAPGVVVVTFDVVPSFDAGPFRLAVPVVAYPDETR